MSMSALDQALETAATENIPVDGGNNANKKDSAPVPDEGSAEEGSSGEGNTDDQNKGERDKATESGNAKVPEVDEDTAAGIALVKLLKNPESRKEALEFLAAENGFTLSQATKEEKKEFNKRVAEVLQEKFGDEMTLLPQGFGDALETILQTIVDERVKPLETQLLTAQQERVNAGLQADLDWAYTNLDGFKDRENEIFEEMQNFQISPKLSVRDYLTKLHKMVVGPTPEKKQTAKAPNPESVKIGGTGGKRIPPRNQAPNVDKLDESILSAMNEVGIE